jgi:hypothetical protein
MYISALYTGYLVEDRMRQYHQHGYNRLMWVETIAINGERAKGVLHQEGIQGPWLTVNWGLSIAQTRGASTPIQLDTREWMICDDVQNWEATRGRTLQMAWIGKCSAKEMKVPPKSTGHRLWSMNVQSMQKHKLPRVDGAILRLPGGASVRASGSWRKFLQQDFPPKNELCHSY